MKQFKNVLKFEYMGYLRSKGFIASTIVLMVLVIAALFIPAIVGAFRSDTSESYGYGQEVVTDVELVPAIIIDYSGFFTEEVLNRHLPGHVWSHGYSEAVAAALVEEGDYYRMALIIAEDGMSFRGYERVAIVFGAGSSQQIRNMIDYVIRRDTLASYGLSSEAIDGYMNLFPFGAPQGWLQNVGADGTNFAFGYVMLFLMFFVVIMYAQFISTSVVVEKSSKAMEVL
ncbi:MAG: ABC transporter permease, partial [Defluviitaleaceae bacterium]|nr:ABC transporter permease [Defluviitaleaceae bacterium]